MSDEKTSDVVAPAAEIGAEDVAVLTAAAPAAAEMAALAEPPPAPPAIGTSADAPVVGSGNLAADVAALGGLKPALDVEALAAVDPDIYINPAGQKFRITRQGSVGVSAVAIK